ncbi:MAG TPA: EamA family transporter [Terriglobales bacterium]|nr:EamA family transporter [Terriglobales bacterium]
MTFRKYLVLAGVAVFAVTGDSLVSRGMKQVGGISLHDLAGIVLVVFRPEVALGVLFLLAFLGCYLAALSWADLTYVLPTTSVSFILLTLVAKFILHENVSLARWLGVLMISLGVGFVTQGPALTAQPRRRESHERVTAPISARTEP